MKKKEKRKSPALTKIKGTRSGKSSEGDLNLLVAQDTLVQYQALKKKPKDAKGTSHQTDIGKSQRLELRLTKHQKEVINKASVVSGFKNVSDYILHIAIADSRLVIREQHLFELSEKDQVTFMETLTNPPKPGKALKNAMKNYLALNKAE